MTTRYDFIEVGGAKSQGHARGNGQRGLLPHHAPAPLAEALIERKTP